jgi:hypothetical protein
MPAAGFSVGRSDAVQSSQTPIIDPNTGVPTPEFYRWMLARSGTDKLVVRAELDDPLILPPSTLTIVPFSIVAVSQGDNGAGFSNSALGPEAYSWKPPRGPVLIIARLLYDGTGSATIGRILTTQLYKNGSFITAAGDYISGIAIPQFLDPTVVYFDSASGQDFYQVYAEQQDTVPRTVANGAPTYFSGISL